MAKLLNLFKENKALSAFALMFLSIGTAYASGGSLGSSAIGSVLEAVTDLAQGDYGALITALVVIFAGSQVYQQNYLQALGAGIFAIVFANVEKLVAEFFEATLPAAASVNDITASITSLTM